MIDEFGEAKMAELLATLGTGIGIDDSLDAVYGFGIDGLENNWREHIGADPYVEATPGPTPTAPVESTPTYKLLTSPPKSSASESTPTKDTDSVDETEPAQFSETTVDTDLDDETVEATYDEPLSIEAEASGGTCSSPSAGSVDGTSGAWLLVVVGLAAGGRYRSRKNR
jgi:MYXO-CTERM domain-containing protein